MNLGKICIFLAVATAFGTETFAQSPPANDNFTNATVLTGTSVAFSGSLVGATIEPAETNRTYPNPVFAQAPSVWWTWTAPQSGIVTVTLRANYTWDHTYPAPWADFEVFTGTDLSSLAWVANSGGFTGPVGRYVSFPATSGTIYYFRVEGTLTAPLMMNLTETNGPIFLLPLQDCAVSPHSCAFFSAIASGPGGNHQTTYHWSYNGVPILQNTQAQFCPSLIVYDVTTNNAGTYSVTASNAFGVVTGSATLSLVDTNPVPSLVALKPSSPSQLPFTLTGEGGRWYKIESSQDLRNWVNPSWFQLANASTLVSVPKLGPNHFVRASLNASTDACVAQLKQMRHAQYLFAIENHKSADDIVSLADLQPYLPLTPLGTIQRCPDGGDYWSPASIFENPSCTLQSRGHQINP